MESVNSMRRSPRETAGILSKLFFCWLVKLLRVARKRDLEFHDLYRVLPEDRSESLGTQLENAWKEQLRQTEVYNISIEDTNNGKKKRPSLFKAIVKVFWARLAMLGIPAFIDECVIKILQPICLGYLLRYFAGEFEQWQGLLFAGGVVLGSAVYVAQHHPFFFGVQHIGMQMRVAVSSVVYRKALTLSQAALGDTTIGQLVNFLSNDVNRFDMAPLFIHYLWIAPVQLGIVIFILWGHFGPACFAGVALLVLFVPFQTQMARLFGKLRQIVAGKTDRRIRIMNEVLGAMRVIKMYSWEIPFSNLVKESRQDEIKYIQKVANLRALNVSIFYVSAKLIIFFTLLAYVLPGNYLTAEKVFVTLSLYNNVRIVMTLFLPMGISTLVEMAVSIRRIEEFLLMANRVMPELGTPSANDGFYRGVSLKPLGIKVTNLFAKWSGDSEEASLSNISLEVKPGQLVAVIGPVGASKSSLLQAILRELPSVSGDIFVSGKIAYVPQEAWIFSGSIRENILFGRPFDPAWYSQVIDACALKKDFSSFQCGDNTIVGDRGASLSGGQKARVNLARAVYSNHECVLLDDPFSPLDASVGRQVFDKCIMGILRNKAVLLVTHQLQFLKPANQILLLNNGRVESQGTYAELVNSGINFAQLLLSEDDGHAANSTSVVKSPAKTRRISGPASTYEASLQSSGVFSPTRKAPGFRRSSSMTFIEMNMFGQYSVPEEFHVEPDPKSMSMSVRVQKQYANNKESALMYPPLKKEYGTFLEPTAEESRNQAANFDEMKSEGNIGLSLYWKYIRAGSNCCSFSLLCIANILTQVFFTGSDYWLQFWTQTEEIRALNETIDSTGNDTLISSAESDSSPSFLQDFIATLKNRDFQVWIYCGIIATLFVISFIRTAAFFTVCMRSSINLHKKLFAGVIGAPMRFFELNPVGRVLNRFAKDIGICDELLPPVLFDTVEISFQVIGIMVVVSIVNPFLVIPALAIGLVFYHIRRFYLKCARSIKRLEGIARSPVFTHLSSSLYGLTTIRAFGVEREFIEQFDTHQDTHSSTWYLFIATARWLGICIDWISVMYIATVTFSFMLLDMDSALVGLAISSSMSLTGMFQWGIRQSAEAENQMVSVERILDYSNLKPEPPLESTPENKPPDTWPDKGEIHIDQMSLRYGSDAPVLHNISFSVKPAEKIGIVGRTGAGKSSLIAALFRIAEPYAGTMIIDNVDILKIGLHDLRSKISIIPQDPVLFMGSLRRNLDPFETYSDQDIWNVLADVHLASAVREMATGLDTEITEGGQNFSVGERQLICLGRAILRKCKIIILDESTANVDPQTDVLIQTTIREKFAACTVLTIAHRLHTVMDSDRILLLDGGRVQEFGVPYTLLQDSSSALHQLVQQTGKAMAASLFKIAFKAYEKRQIPLGRPPSGFNLEAVLPEEEILIDLADTSEDENENDEFPLLRPKSA